MQNIQWYIMEKQKIQTYGKIEDTNLNETLASIQVEYGSKANSYTPYGTTPIELCKIGNYQDSIKKSTGKNLYDVDSESTDDLINSSGFEITNSSFNTSDYILIKGNTSYNLSWKSASTYFQAYIAYYDSNKTFIQRDDITTSNTYTKAFTTLGNAKYIRISYSKEVSGTPSPRTNIQLEVGSSASDYQPYGVGKWYLHKEIEKVVFNGSEDWTKTSDTSASVFVTAILGRNTSLSSSSLSNYFKYQFANVEGKFYFGSSSSNNCAFCMATTYTLESFKTWLSTNNPFVYYVLATPTNTEITYQPLIDQLNLLEKAMSKDGQTNISQVSNDKPFILDVTAIKSLQNILDRIELLESQEDDR